MAGEILEEGAARGWTLLSVERIAIQAGKDEHFGFLRQAAGEVVFPVAVGTVDAAALKKMPEGGIPARPLTHELF